jgi:hypothetical protein
MLTLAQKRFNSELSKERVLVEHTISRMRKPEDTFVTTRLEGK